MNTWRSAPTLFKQIFGYSLLPEKEKKELKIEKSYMWMYMIILDFQGTWFVQKFLGKNQELFKD